MKRIPPKPGQESVWDYPRPPKLEPATKPVKIIFNGETVAESTRAFRVLETSHPPVYYLPQADIRMELLEPTGYTTHCEFKGAAHYWTLCVTGKEVVNAAWSYPDPVERFAELKDHLAFYPSKMDACYVGDERVQAQAGDFYGGWITSDIVGPFKGGTGTWGW